MGGGDRYDDSYDEAQQSFDVSIADHERFQTNNKMGGGGGGNGDEQSMGKLEEAETFVCAPYKAQLIQMELDNALLNNTDHNNIIAKLCEMGIKVYLVMYDSEDLKEDLIKIVEDASNDDRTTSDFNRVCLYKDEQGRVFNLILSGASKGLGKVFGDNLAAFSGLQATSAIAILSRSLGCIPQMPTEFVGPAGRYLSLIVGLILSEEIGHSILNVSMFVNGMPSTGAHSLTNSYIADVPRNLVLFGLAASSFVGGGSVQGYMVLAGIALTIFVLAANLGSRVWNNMCLSPLRYTGVFSTFIGYVLASIVGLVVPYLGFREVETGGQAAVESLTLSSILVGIAFLASDISFLQSFLVVGSETCNQGLVNMAVGGWFFISVMASILLSGKIKSRTRNLDEEEFLDENDNSPVGFTCPTIPNFYIDPILLNKPHLTCCVNENLVKMLSGIVAAVIAGGIISIGLFKEEIEAIAGMNWY